MLNFGASKPRVKGGLGLPPLDPRLTGQLSSVNAIPAIWDILTYYTYYLIFMKKMFWLNDLRRYAEWSEARKFYDMGGEK